MTYPASPSPTPGPLSRAPSSLTGAINTSARSAADHADFVALSSVLSGERPIAYSVNLARVVGDVKATLFLSQLIYWTRVGVNVEHHGGWIFKSREQWTAETGLSRYEQESARVKLLKQGLIEEARVGSPARNCYRVVPQVLGSALARLLRSEPVQWTLFDIRSNAEQFKALLGRNLAFYRVFTEITPTVATAVFLTKAISVHRSVLNAQLEREARATLKPAAASSDWFSLSPTQWQEETGLTTAQQRECKQKLCQLNYIKESVQTFPKRRTYIQLSMPTVSAALKSYVLSKVASGESSGGILGVLSKGLQQSNRLNEVRLIGAVRHTDQVGRNCLVDTPSQVGKNCLLEAKTTSSEPVCENPPSSFHDSTNLDGGFSHIRRMEITHQSVGNSTVRRGLLTPLHARARSLTTKDLNTTTTTKPLIGNAKTIHQDGGKSQTPVVVVPLEKNQEEKKPVDQDLVWFNWMPIHVQTTCSQLLKASRLTSVRQQVLIAELAGNLLEANKIKNPLTYFAALIRSEKSAADGIIPLAAQFAWRKHRYEIEAQQRLANAITNSGNSSTVPERHAVDGRQLTPAQQATQNEIAQKLAAIANPAPSTPEALERSRQAREKLKAMRAAIPIPIKSTKP